MVCEVKMTRIRDLDNCPECGESWIGNPIPEESQKHYGGKKFFGRIIGVEDPEIYDGVSWWMCPVCKTRWNRWTDEKVVK